MVEKKKKESLEEGSERGPCRAFRSSNARKKKASNEKETKMLWNAQQKIHRLHSSTKAYSLCAFSPLSASKSASTVAGIGRIPKAGTGLSKKRRERMNASPARFLHPVLLAFLRKEVKEMVSRGGTRFSSHRCTTPAFWSRFSVCFLVDIA